jgi:hypothetical protein
MTLDAVRRTQFILDMTHADGGLQVPVPTVRVAVLAAIRNPLAFGQAGSLDLLTDLSYEVAEHCLPRAIALLGAPAEAYGKGAVVGTGGELEHAAALLHPALGVPMRASIGGGKALIGAAAKVGAPGTALDVPINHKDDIWSFDHLDTLTVAMSDAPLPDEILLVMVFAAGGRIRARVQRRPPPVPATAPAGS